MKIVTMSVLVALLATSAHAEERVRNETAVSDGRLKITVYRSPTCDCCGKWMDYLKKRNFSVTEIPTNRVTETKLALGVPESLASCHTAVINGYVIEGHVPADDIGKLLQSRSTVAGIAVPGMPTGSPGMEMGDRKDPFTVLAFDRKGKAEKFNEYLSY